MSKQPFLPLFFGDLLGATATWEGEERALYILLLAYQWTSGPLPKDPKRIARMCQYDAKNFTTLWETVGKKFVETEDGLINKRLEEHRNKSINLANKRANAGANGAAKRWQKDKQPNGKSDSKHNSNEIAIATDLQCHPSHPIPSHISPVVTQSHPDTLLLSHDEDKPRAENRQISREGEMAIALRDLGVQVTSAHPTLVTWIADGFTTQQAVDATALARMRKPHPEPIPAAYLDKILRQPKREESARKTKFDRAMEELNRA
jgi:uncharacterized protein YdaU (DUF1376 family)